MDKFYIKNRKLSGKIINHTRDNIGKTYLEIFLKFDHNNGQKNRVK